MLNELLLKKMCAIAGIFGLALGFLTIIPFVCNFSFFALIVLAAPIMLIYMKKINMLGILEPKLGAMYGGILGFVSFFAFSISFVPLATIIGLMYKGSFYLGVSLLFRSGFFVLVMTIFFVALLSALLNAFSGMVTMYVYNQIEPQPEETKTSIDIKE